MKLRSCLTKLENLLTKDRTVTFPYTGKITVLFLLTIIVHCIIIYYITSLRNYVMLNFSIGGML
jgi:hypothetical protein